MWGCVVSGLDLLIHCIKLAKLHCFQVLTRKLFVILQYAKTNDNTFIGHNASLALSKSWLRYKGRECIGENVCNQNFSTSRHTNPWDTNHTTPFLLIFIFFFPRVDLCFSKILRELLSVTTSVYPLILAMHEYRAFFQIVLFLLLFIFGALLVSWIKKWYRLRHIQAPWLASISDAWMIQSLLDVENWRDIGNICDRYGISICKPLDWITYHNLSDKACGSKTAREVAAFG